MPRAKKPAKRASDVTVSVRKETRVCFGHGTIRTGAYRSRKTIELQSLKRPRPVGEPLPREEQGDVNIDADTRTVILAFDGPHAESSALVLLRALLSLYPHLAFYFPNQIA